MKFLLKYLELVFTAAGLFVIFGVTALVHPADLSSWAVAAVTATLVGVIHGVLFWIVRQRQRTLRGRAISEAKTMLRDQIMNRLAVIRLGLELQPVESAGEPRQAVRQLGDAIDAIYEAVDGLSEERLTRWQSRYRQTLQRP